MSITSGGIGRFGNTGKATQESNEKLRLEVEVLTEEIRANSQELVRARKIEEAKMPPVANWKHVDTFPESKRFPLVQYEQSTQNISVMIFDPLKKLNIL